jgi:hypothetical protein
MKPGYAKQRSGNKLIPEMLALIRQERAAALKASDEATAKMKLEQEQTGGPMQEAPQLDVPHEKEGNGESEGKAGR